MSSFISIFSPLIEPDHPRALSNLKSYESTISSDEVLLLKSKSSDEVQLHNERHRDEYKTTDEYRDYERLCRGEQTHVGHYMSDRGVVGRGRRWTASTQFFV